MQHRKIDSSVDRVKDTASATAHDRCMRESGLERMREGKPRAKGYGARPTGVGPKSKGN